MKTLALLTLVAIPVLGSAQVLNANAAPNNGSGGIFMDLTPTTQSLNVTRFDTFFGSATVGAAFQVQVWTRTGTYVGFQSSNVGWTLLDTVNGTSNGTATTAGVVLNNLLTLNASQTTGVLLHSITTGNGIRYFGTGTTSNTNFANADLSMFTAHSRTGAAAFAGSLFTPRAYAGSVSYTPVPEPATMAVLGLGVAALLRRRRKA